jgi:hypothetical protein
LIERIATMATRRGPNSMESFDIVLQVTRTGRSSCLQAGGHAAPSFSAIAGAAAQLSWPRPGLKNRDFHNFQRR